MDLSIRRLVVKLVSFRHGACTLAILLSLYASTSCSSEMIGPGVRFTAQQRQVADQIISVFENNTPLLQYGYAAELGDGRGITAGRAGFTSATGDMHEVVSRYSKRVPGNPLQPYLLPLKLLAQSGSADTRTLAGLDSAWETASRDWLFRSVQDQVVDEFYYNPAAEYSGKVGATHALSLLILYDTAIQHGMGSDPDGLPALVRRTNAELHDSAGSEQAWNTEFLQQRRRTLNHASSASTRAEWAESVGRVDTLQSLVDEGNTQLRGSIVIDTWGTSFIVGASPEG